MYGNTSRSRGHSTSQDRMGGPSQRGGASHSADRGGGGGWRGGRGRRDGGARGGRGGQGGRGGRGGHERSNRKLEQFGFRNLQSMAEKDADELVLDMTSERCILATENLVSETIMDDGKVIVVLKVFAKACDCLTALSSLNNLLSKLPKSRYMSFHLSNYINRLANVEKEVDEREDELRLMIDLFTALLRKLPNSFADLPIPELYLAVMMLNNKGALFDQKILPAVQALGNLKDEMAEKVKHEQEQTSRRPKRYNRRDEAALLDEEAPPDDFRDMSVVPTQDDVHATGVPFLRRNKVDGSYNSPEHYLDVQFRLLREDFVRPLRDGINDMLVRMGSDKMRPLQDIRVYHDVHILFPVFTSKGLTYKIGFDVNRLRSVRWENSKRLIYGSLLCLSKDKFETIILATVENRDVKELKEGRVEIRFTNTFERINQDKCSYQMVETTAYFEAYRHVLEGLKVIEPDRIPFKRYIVDCKCDTKPPAYLRNRLREGITYDLSPIMNKNTRDPLASLRRKGEAVRILDDSSWPSAEDLELDESQFKAVKLALTSEFSLIQGPPGTGKTYIGLKVVKVLLHNKDKWMRGTEDDDEDDDERLLRHRRPIRTSAASHPILVVCYTNHALDQFLEGIHEFHSEGIVRIGGRSQSEIMDKCSLRELKHQMQKKKETPIDIRQAFYEIHCDLDTITNQMKAATDSLQKCMENLVDEKELCDGNFMTQEHFNQMTIDPATGVRSKQTMMCYWLGLMADGPFESSKAVNPIAIFPFTKLAKRNNLLNQHHVAFINKAKLAPGIDGSNGGSYELQGARDSFIYIPNMPDGILDTWQSMTILLYVYPMSPYGGPIVCFQDQGIIGIEVSQDGVENGKGILKAVFNRRDGAPLIPLRKAVLNMNQWNYIAASYDYESGFYRLWHDGKLVQELQNMNGQIVIGSQFPVYLGSFNLNWHTSYFEGRVCGLNIFPAAIGKQQICRIAGIREEDLVQQNDDDEEEEANGGQEEDEEEKEKEEKDNDILYEAEAEQVLRVLDVDEVTRFGEKRGRQVTKTLMLADPFLNDATSIPDTFQFQSQQKKSRKKKINDKIKRELSHGDMMSQQQARRVVDIWALSVKDKWRLYRYWIDQLCTNYRQIVERNVYM